MLDEDVGEFPSLRIYNGDSKLTENQLKFDGLLVSDNLVVLEVVD